MSYLGIDLETFSAADLKAVGAHRYAEDPSFEVLLFGFAFDDDDPTVIDLTAHEPIPKDVLDALRLNGIIKSGWNIAFERACLARHLGFDQPAGQWEDTMVLASVCGLPMGLGDCGAALHMSADKAKDKDGKALIRWFCKPCKPTKTRPELTRHMPADYPDKWERFKEYNGQDVVAERAIRKLLAQWAPTGMERRIWAVDQQINDRGIRVDLTLANAAREMDAQYKARLTAQAIALTGLENPSSVAQVKAWLAEQEGREFPTLNKKAVADVVASLSSEKARAFMKIRSELARSATKKYDAMVSSACADGHVRGCFQFCGAGRTGRWSGRRVQLQNLAKNKMPDLAACRALVRSRDLEAVELLYGDVASALSELVRTAFIPEEGHKFIVCDYSAIEARVLSWIAGEEWALEEFRGKGQIYEATGAMMFHVPKETIAKGGVNHHRRQAAKTAVLACGYGGGVNALLAFGADKMGMGPEDMAETVDLWRKANPRVVALWKDLERTAIRCVVRGTEQTSRIGNIHFEMEKGILWMTLPSGRRIAYFGARYGESRWQKSRVLSYMGIEQKTHKWARIETWGGKLTENCWGAGTPVLTDRGWVPIERVEPRDKLWDGMSWVSHGGRFCSGRKSTITVDGLSVTPDHLILTTEGWTHAERCEGLHRARVQLPNGDRPKRDAGQPRQAPVGRPMPVRGNKDYGHQRSSQEGAGRSPHILRLPKEEVHIDGKQTPRDEHTSGLRSMAVHEGALYGPEAPRLEELWGPWDHGKPCLDGELRSVLERHGADLLTGVGVGPAGQREGVQPGELPVGGSKTERPEQKRRQDCGTERETDTTERAVSDFGYQVYDFALPAGPRLSVRRPVDPSGHEEQVFDIMNAGPHHRYVVLGDHGPMVVHNCVQATARDCLRDAMVNLAGAGFDIRAHIHDEVIVTEPKDGRSVEEVSAVMGRDLPWAPGLPLRGDGYECDFYMKD